MKDILITDAENLRRIIDFARAEKCEAELGLALVRLLECVTMGMRKPWTDVHDKAEETEGNMTAVIGKDFAPFSLRWALFKDATARLENPDDRRVVYHGGWIYSGPGGARSDGGFPSLTVSLDADASTGAKHMWSIHT
jgi:hypothetical protein